jgi:hypothetical protein
MTAQLLAAADRTCNAILNAITDTRDDVVANSPPGGGKTRLLEDATGHAALALDRRVIIACPSNDQANDATCRIADAFPQLRVDRFMANGASRPAMLSYLDNVGSRDLDPGFVGAGDRRDSFQVYPDRGAQFSSRVPVRR